MPFIPFQTVVHATVMSGLDYGELILTQRNQMITVHCAPSPRYILYTKLLNCVMKLAFFITRRSINFIQSSAVTSSKLFSHFNHSIMMHDPIMDYDYLTLDIPYLHIILVGLYLYCAYSTCSEMQTSLKLSSSLLKLYYQSFF